MQRVRGLATTAGLGAAMAISNIAGYLFVIAVSRSLGPTDFGGLSALSAYGIVLSVPAGAYQVVVARHRAAERAMASVVRNALLLGTALAGFSVVVAPVVAEVLDLRSAWSVVWLGLTLVPMTLTGVWQGELLGAHRIAELGSLYLINGSSRLVVGIVAAVFSFDVTAVFFALFLAAAITSFVGSMFARGGFEPGKVRIGSELVASTAALGAYIALTNIDLVWARAFLPATDSGGYALASTLARAIGWGTQFVALLVVPRLQHRSGGPTMVLASAVTVALGLGATAVVAINPQWWITLIGGEAYAQYGYLLVGCGLLGTAWSLVQLWLFAEMGRGRAVLGAVAWLGVAVESLGIGFWHDSPLQIVFVNAAVAAGLVAIAVVLEAFRSRSVATAT